MNIVPNIIGALLGFPLLAIGFTFVCIGEAITRASCWLLGIEYDQEDDGDDDEVW